MLLEGLPIGIKALDYLFGGSCQFRDKRNLKIDISINNEKRKSLMRQLFID